MIEFSAAQIIPAFIAGLITFLAPCTLPLVPGYIGFISGVSIDDIQSENDSDLKKKVIINALLFVLGFTIVFMIMGSIFGLFGRTLAEFRIWLTRIGGVFVILFGLYMMHIFKLPFLDFLQKEKRFNIASKIKPGSPMSSFIFGASFAFGWTPCVGPLLGTILILASSSGTVLEGTFLLFIFSLGLAIPFLVVALAFGHAAEYIKKISKYLNIVSFIGGLFLVFLGYLLVTDQFGVWTSYLFQLLDGFNYEEFIYQYL